MSTLIAVLNQGRLLANCAWAITSAAVEASSRSQLSLNSNNFIGLILFPVVFSEKLGISEDTSTGYK
ncbi:hypothetical protein TNCV_4097881 [Trichonephila clavipes]|nr:hypothetical protein TNCV_4097881 [Trichonephila clavipes]